MDWEYLAPERRRAGLSLKRQTIGGGLDMPHLEGGRGEMLRVHGSAMVQH